MSAGTAAGARGYRDQVGAHPSPWRGVVPALDVFLHDLGLGIFLAATLGALLAPAAMTPLLGVAWPFSLAVVGVDMLLLLFDLGDWTRFFHMFRVFKPGTPMSLGVWSLTAFLTAAALPAAWGALSLLGAAPAEPGPVVKGLAAAALLLALPATVYKGAVFSVTAQRGWGEARWTAGFLSASAVLLGVATLAPLAAVLESPAAGLLWRAALPLLVLDALLLLAWRRGSPLQWGARVAAAALLALAPPTPLATLTLAALLQASAYAARRTFMEAPFLGRPRVQGPEPRVPTGASATAVR